MRFNIQDFYEIMNEPDPDLQFIFEELTTNINLKIINDKLHFDVSQKTTDFCSYLHYKSCHPPHTQNNILLSLARHIVWIFTDNENNRLQELKDHLLKRKYRG